MTTAAPTSPSTGTSSPRTGEPDLALDQLEPLLQVPFYLSPGWLRIDPTFDPLRKYPRFQRLASASIVDSGAPRSM